MTGLSSRQHSERARWLSKPLFWISLAVIFVVVLIAANAHLVIVAFDSQPDCVPHDKVADGSTTHMRAAKSGC